MPLDRGVQIDVVLRGALVERLALAATLQRIADLGDALLPARRSRR
jgi:hypothetical protein